MVELLYEQIYRVTAAHVRKSKPKPRKYPTWFSTDLIRLLNEKTTIVFVSQNNFN